jgi:hypothetical protein
MGRDGTGAVQATDVARIRALRDFLSKGEADDRLRRQELAARTKRRGNSHRDSRNGVLAKCRRHLCRTIGAVRPRGREAQLVGLRPEFRNSEAKFLELPDCYTA